MRDRLLHAAVALLAGAFFLQAAPEQIVVDHAALRLIPGVPAAGYFDLVNKTAAPLVLTGIKSGDCGSVMMHRSTIMGGMSRMESVSSVTVESGGHFAFAPGGYHLMCTNPSPRLRVGGEAHMMFIFAGGLAIPAAFGVVNARGAAQ